jgi:UV excision repair protein RAD23
MANDEGEGVEDSEQPVPGQGQQGPPPPGTILISQADEQAINRLRQLGFSKLESAQAYFACDKNEELAANLLFDRLANGDIEMEPQPPAGHGGPGQGGPGGQGGQGGSANNEDDDNLFN